VHPELSLAGTRSSHRWAQTPGNWDRLNTRAIFPSSNEHGIPDLPAARAEPARLVVYSDRHACREPRDGDCVAFFDDDYRFETVWTKPERPLPRLARVGLALTPDFSLWTAMPRALQLFQVYRSRWCGAWMLSHGIGVIPTASWSTPDSHAFAFAGIAEGSVVAVSSVGVLRDRQALRLFAAGYEAMLAAVRPSLVLCYGRLPDGLPDAPVRAYPTRWEGRGWADGEAPEGAARKGRGPGPSPGSAGSSPATSPA
jgi:hypothetical protein